VSVLRVLIVDDEPLAREGIRLLLEAEPDIEIAGEATDGAEAVAAIERLRPDLVFLDVQMPGMTGLEVLSRVEVERMPEVVFCTAYDQYALQAFEHHALDYLLKPFDDERFHGTLERARSRIRDRGADNLGRKMLAMLAEFGAAGAAVAPGAPQSPFADRLAVKTGGRTYFLRADEIDWIEAADYYVKLHVDGKEHLLRESMNKLEKELDPQRFLRVHRSSIVNLDRVKELHGRGNEHAVVLQDGTRLKLSRSRREKLNALLHRR